MSKLDSTMYQIPLPTFHHYRILNSKRSSIGTKSTIMIPINEKEELLIDNIDKQTLHFHRGNRTFSVQMKDIYCYGEVDFTDKDTLDKINDFKFLDYLEEVGVRIYSNYDYETHSCSSPTEYCLWTETWHPAVLAKMAHGYLGKPKRILLFSQISK